MLGHAARSSWECGGGHCWKRCHWVSEVIHSENDRGTQLDVEIVFAKQRRESVLCSQHLVFGPSVTTFLSPSFDSQPEDGESACVAMWIGDLGQSRTSNREGLVAHDAISVSTRDISIYRGRA